VHVLDPDIRQMSMLSCVLFQGYS